MAERRRPGRPASTKLPVVGIVRDHRANDLLFGHVGRMTYVSPEDDGGSRSADGDDSRRSIGKLLTNRLSGSIHTFQEVARFQAWYPPTAYDVSGIRSMARQYLNRLLLEAPETLAGVSGPSYPGFLQDAQDSEVLKSLQTRLPLLSYGEITDLSPREPTGRPALAMAMGQSGHALRIVQVRREDWGWSLDGSASMKLSNINTEDEGHWCDNALSINQIKFTSNDNSDSDNNSGQAKRQTRWILVQTAAETIVFQPTLHGVPVQKKQCTCDHMARGPSYITADPIMRIPIKETGGRAHCDVAFNPATETRPPQLAIIDESGQWSVWNVAGNMHVRKNILLPFLQARGTFTDGVIPNPSLAAVRDLGHLHRVAWLPTSLADAERLATSAPRRGSGKAKTEAVAPSTNCQPNMLLVCNATSVNVIDVEQKNGSLRTFNAAHNVGLDTVVDIQVSPINASHVFVLTTTTIFWLDLSQLDILPSPGGSKSNAKQPFLLLSCPHLRGPADKTIKFSLTQSKSQQGKAETVVLIYSMKNPEVAVFWFPEISNGGEATYQQQIFQLARPRFGNLASKTKLRHLGQQTMLLLPKQVRIATSNARPRDYYGQQYTRAGTSVFQVIALGADLSLWSSLCASSSRRSLVKLAPFAPILKRKHWQKASNAERRQKAGANYFRSCFVVPDDFEEHMLLSDPKPDHPSVQIMATVAHSTPARTFEIYNMARLFRLLRKNLGKIATASYETTDVIRGFQNPSPLDMIQQILDIATEHGSFAYTTLLNISNEEYIREFGADLTDFSWTRQLAELGSIEDARVSISSQMQEGRTQNGGAATLYEVMARLCAVAMVVDGRRHDNALARRRQGLLAYAAVQLFFSQISMVVMPRLVSYSARNTPGFEDGLSAASTPYSAHFPRPDTESRFRDVLSSSPPPPTPRGVPSWLPPSSQDYGMGDGIIKSMEDVDGAQAEQGEQEGQEDEELQEDPVVARLRQYAKSIKSEPPRKEGELRLLSHWHLGSDPAQFHWVPMGAAGEAEEEMRRQAQEARDRRRKRVEERAMRDRERLLMVSGGVGGGGISSPAVPRIQPSSQIMPSRHLNIMSSQAAMASPRVASPGMASQVFSSQVLPSSQPAIRAGTFGQRPKKKKPKAARGFK